MKNYKMIDKMEKVWLGSWVGIEIKKYYRKITKRNRRRNMDKSTKYKFHFLELDKTGMGKKTVSSAEISKQYSDVEITLEEFIKAVITCGMPMYYLTPGITYSRRNEIAYKLYALLTLLEFDSKNKYIKIRKEIKYQDNRLPVKIKYIKNIKKDTKSKFIKFFFISSSHKLKFNFYILSLFFACAKHIHRIMMK